MKYCTQCGSEYEDGVTTCVDDGSTELVSLEEMHRRGLVTQEERDTRKFIRAGVAEDPLSAERFTQLLDQEGIPVFARPRRTGTVDSITSGVSAPWWELLVPEEHAAKASALIEGLKRDLEADPEGAARAAEEEFENPPS